MDTALQLKMDIDSGKRFSENQILEKLEASDLVKELTTNFPKEPLSLVWRLIALSEIPFGEKLAYTQKAISEIYKNFSTPYGFSLSGDKKQFLPCYNAMIISSLCRLGRANDDQVKNAVQWIGEFQPMRRNIVVNIPGFRFDRYGGCFKYTPCYIGVAKSVIALHNYQHTANDQSYKLKLDEGTEYLLSHHLFKRLSNGKPITKHILDISFPESYHLNIVKLIRFAEEANILHDPRTKDALEYLKGIQKGGEWKVSFRYKAKGYTVFDKAGKSGEWVTYIINKAINKANC